MKTVKDLFKVDVFKDVEVIAGEEGLDRVVESVEVSDTPDVYNYFSDNSLLLTTAYAFQENPEELCTLITQLNNHACSGIAIKLKRFIYEIPQKVIDLANSLKFPILIIPSRYTLGNVAQPLLSFLWDNKTEQLYYATKVQKRFTQMMLKGYDLHSMIENLGYFLHAPIMLMNPLGDIISYSQHFNRENMKNVKENVQALFKSEINSYREKEKIYITNPNSNLSAMSINIYKVKTKLPIPYLLLVYEAEKLKYPFSQLAIEQASTVISFTLLKNEAIRESKRLTKNNFFGSFVSGNIKSKDEIIHRGKVHGLLEEGVYLCVVFKEDEEKNGHTILQSDLLKDSTFELLYSSVNKTIGTIGKDSILFIKDKYFVMILQSKENNDNLAKHILKEKIKRFQEDVRKVLNISLSFGIGNYVNDVTNIPFSYTEAVDSWEEGAKIFGQNFINFYEAKNLLELIQLIPKKKLEEFYRNTLRTLAYPKTKEDEDLVNTLSVFLDNNCHISDTAKKLFIHRNTVKYRIAKCEEILNTPIQEEQMTLNLRIALLLRKSILNNNDSQ